MIKAARRAVRNGAICPQGCKTAMTCVEQPLFATDIQKSFLLTSKRGVREIFRGRRRSHGNFRNAAKSIAQTVIGADDLITQRARQLSLENQSPCVMTGTTQLIDVFVVDAAHQFPQRLLQPVRFEEQTVRIARRRESINRTDATRAE